MPAFLQETEESSISWKEFRGFLVFIEFFEVLSSPFIWWSRFKLTYLNKFSFPRTSFHFCLHRHDISDSATEWSDYSNLDRLLARRFVATDFISIHVIQRDDDIDRTCLMKFHASASFNLNLIVLCETRQEDDTQYICSIWTWNSIISDNLYNTLSIFIFSPIIWLLQKICTTYNKRRKKLRGKSAFLTDRRKLGGLSFCHLLLVWRNHIWRRHTNGMPLMCDLHTTHVDDIFISTSSCIAWWRTLKRHAGTTHLPFMPIN